jgi:hypothetical protein
MTSWGRHGPSSWTRCCSSLGSTQTDRSGWQRCSWKLSPMILPVRVLSLTALAPLSYVVSRRWSCDRVLHCTAVLCYRSSSRHRSGGNRTSLLCYASANSVSLVRCRDLLHRLTSLHWLPLKGHEASTTESNRLFLSPSSV